MSLLEPPIAVSFHLAFFKEKHHKPKMSSFEFDMVMAEKADAIRRYNRKKNFTFCLQVTGALVLLFYSLTCFPVITESPSNYLSTLNKQFYVFVLIHFIIGVIYLLSTTANNNHENEPPLIPTDFYDEFVLFSTSSPRWKTSTTATNDNKQLVVDSPLPEEPPEDNLFHNDKQIVPSEKISNSEHVPEEENNINPVRDLAVTNDCYSVEKAEKPYRRTRSVRYGREKKECLKELKRSETEITRREMGQMAVTGGYMPLKKSMHEMNSEEFRLTIESFIASKKKILREENIALLSEETKENMALTYR